MFKSQQDEVELLTSLKGNIEEWGPEAIIVHLPVKWFRSDYNLGDRVELKFDTQNTAEIEIKYGITNYRAKVIEFATD